MQPDIYIYIYIYNNNPNARSAHAARHIYIYIYIEIDSVLTQEKLILIVVALGCHPLKWAATTMSQKF
jgi:hypothetical protein